MDLIIIIIINNIVKQINIQILVNQLVISLIFIIIINHLLLNTFIISQYIVILFIANLLIMDLIIVNQLIINLLIIQVLIVKLLVQVAMQVSIEIIWMLLILNYYFNSKIDIFNSILLIFVICIYIILLRQYQIDYPLNSL